MNIKLMNSINILFVLSEGCVSLYQMFIGHSQPIRQVGFTPDQLGVVSVGDAIFFWDFLAHPADLLTDSR